MTSAENPLLPIWHSTQRLWQKMSKARRTMTVALAVLFVSQFFAYAEDRGYGVLSMDSNYNTSGTYWVDLEPSGTGWEIHPYARLIIPFLAFAYITSLCEQPWWRNWGYLASVMLVFICLSPGQQWMPGTRLGFVSLGLAIWAAVQNRRARKAEQAAQAQTPVT
jgi:hypothetical protein